MKTRACLRNDPAPHGAGHSDRCGPARERREPGLRSISQTPVRLESLKFREPPSPRSCERERADSSLSGGFWCRPCIALAAFAAAALLSLARADDPDLAARISRVEHGLLPAARIAGAPAESWSVTDRLTFHHVPAISVAVIDHDALAWARAYGFPRRAAVTPADPDTLFQAASLSKIVTAAAALTLVQDGHLALDTDINEKLITWKLPAAAVAQGSPVTLRELLSHTAGLSVHGFRGYAPDEPRPTLAEILDGQPPANSAPIRLQFQPGTRWQYAGGGYCVVQQLLLDATGRDFPVLLHDRVLEPAGMTASAFAQPLPDSLQSHAATGHHADDSSVTGGAHVYPELAAAGLWTTPSDLARLLLALGRALRGEPAPLTRASAEAMITPPLPGSSYGLGVGVTGSGDRLQLSHGGANEGFRCMAVYYPRLGRGAVVMTNSDTGLALGNELLRALAREYDWPGYQVVEKAAVPLTPAAFDNFAGRYERDDAVLLFSRQDARFYVRGTQRPRTEIFARSDHEFFTLTSDDVFSFEGDVEAKPTHVVLRAGAPLIFQRVR